MFTYGLRSDMLQMKQQELQKIRESEEFVCLP